MDEQAEAQAPDFVALAADLVAAYVSNNRVSPAELLGVIASVHTAFAGLANGPPTEPAGPEKPTPAQVRKSITPDALISFIDGKPYKTLKRHLTKNGLTLEGYRARYGLSADYPATSAAYSAKRSELARTLGLGQLRRASPEAATPDETSARTSSKGRGGMHEAADAPVEAPATAPKGRGRRKVVEEA